MTHPPVASRFAFSSLVSLARRAADGGTASFTSIRRGKQGVFEVLRWRVTRDDGKVLDLRPEEETPLPLALA